MSTSKTTMIINGRTVDLLALTAGDMDFTRMFRGLSGIVRFNGYSGWTVAQHSLLLSLITETLARCSLRYYGKRFLTNEEDSGEARDVLLKLLSDTQQDQLFKLHDHLELGAGQRELRYVYYNGLVKLWSYQLAKDALIHDFSEALTGDIIRPFKQLVSEIRELEGKVDVQIRNAYGLETEMPPLVDILDKQLAVIEAYHLTRVYGKSLLNEADSFHLSSFNAMTVDTTVIDTYNYYVGNRVLQVAPPSLDKPLTEAFIRKFLSTSALPFADIMRMTETEVVNAATERLMVLESQIAHWQAKINHSKKRALLAAEQKTCMTS